MLENEGLEVEYGAVRTVDSVIGVRGQGGGVPRDMERVECSSVTPIPFGSGPPSYSARTVRPVVVALAMHGTRGSHHPRDLTRGATTSG